MYIPLLTVGVDQMHYNVVRQSLFSRLYVVIVRVYHSHSQSSKGQAHIWSPHKPEAAGLD